MSIRLPAVLRILLLFAASCSLLAGLPLAAQEAPPVMTSVVVPVVGSVLGANDVHWKTDLELHNDGRAEATVSLVLPTAPEQPAIITTVPGGSSVRFSDVVGEAFGMASALSPLLVQTLGRRSVSIRATAYGVRGGETFTPEPITINYGPTYFPVRVLQGLSFNDDYRTNIGLVNIGEKDATFVMALQRLPGRNLAVVRTTLAPNTLWHVPIQFLFPLITSGDDFSILVECHTPDTYLYASVIENQTNTARFVQSIVGPLH